MSFFDDYKLNVTNYPCQICFNRKPKWIIWLGHEDHQLVCGVHVTTVLEYFEKLRHPGDEIKIRGVSRNQ